jgi:hypothetical protein
MPHFDDVDRSPYRSERLSGRERLVCDLTEAKAPSYMITTAYYGWYHRRGDIEDNSGPMRDLLADCHNIGPSLSNIAENAINHEYED